MDVRDLGTGARGLPCRRWRPWRQLGYSAVDETRRGHRVRNHRL